MFNIGNGFDTYVVTSASNVQRVLGFYYEYGMYLEDILDALELRYEDFTDIDWQMLLEQIPHN